MFDMTLQASCLIKTRMYHLGFPNRFQYYPEMMSPADLEELHSFALDFMDDPKEIDTPDSLRRCVIVGENYCVAGIAGFLCDILGELSEAYNGFCDASGTRKVYGFFAFVLEPDQKADFPQTEHFRELIRRLILPYWRERDHSAFAARLQKGIGLEAVFPLPTAEEAHSPEEWLCFNSDREKLGCVYTPDTFAVLNEAMRRNGKEAPFSLSTGLERSSRAAASFLNICFPSDKSCMETFARAADTEQGAAEREETCAAAEATKRRGFGGGRRGKKLELRFMIDEEGMSCHADEIGLLCDTLLDAPDVMTVSNPTFTQIDGSVYLLQTLTLKKARDTQAVIRDARQRISERHRKGQLRWISGDDIGCTNDSDALPKAMLDKGSALASFLRNKLGRKQSAEEGADTPETEDVLSLLERLYGAGGGKTDREPSAEQRGDERDPFEL